MKEKLLLAAFGLCLGAICLAGAYFGASALGLLPFSGSDATHFESVEEFHRKMLSRDEDSNSSEQSVTLRSIITPHPNELVMYDLLPDKDVIFQRSPVRLNSCGMRGADVAVQNKTEKIRIAFLGDSFTFGWGVKEQEAFVSVTENLLNRFLEDSRQEVEILNFGTPGYSTFQEVELFLKEDIEFRPDIVVVFFISNDFGLPFFIRDVGSTGEMMTSTNFEKQVSSQKHGSAVQVERSRIVSNLDPNKALRKLARRGRKEGYETFIAFNPHPKWKENLRKLWFVRKTKLLKTITLRERFLAAMETFGVEEKDLSLSFDPHPSASKHAILGGLLAESLFPEVDRLAEARK